MIKTRICAECGHLVTEALESLRLHEATIVNGLSLNLEGYLTEESRRQLAPEAVASFNAAQDAWEKYCKHLEMHGLLAVAAKSRSVA